MYIETILLFQQNAEYVRSVDIATEPGYSKASISRAMKIWTCQQEKAHV